MPKVDSKECIDKDDTVYNNNEKINNYDKILNNNVWESSIDNISEYNINLPNKPDKGMKAKSIKPFIQFTITESWF